MYSTGPDHSRITALLGPTNTGKTHRAVERMLEHRSGMMGLPLRLLAREVYDRVSSRVGENRVALVTGEEKRVPPRPDYWVCTVEAMPLELAVDFVAVDEIQLAAHDQRGHTFTDRLLHLRGDKETWFLGSSPVKPLIAQLVPTAEVLRQPRLSRLRHRGRHSLKALPRRSAVVAFSQNEVYELAERVRREKGGAAVVLGALSPRTRNAQVAMYQAGEVDCIVATDAIGMGLNLDIDHVAFASLSKFDGKEVRPLNVAELAQIAGRAGRYTNDGTFGTLAPLPELPSSLVHAIEQHEFPPLKRLLWRNRDLDFTSVEALIASLLVMPSVGCLQRVETADDMTALLALTADPEIRRRVQEEAAVGLLWEVCQVPDFRKLLPDSHFALLKELFLQLSSDASCLQEPWMRERITRLDDPIADIDTLMMRLAFIRTWTYVVHRRGWVPRARYWQEETQAIEERLSDALHAALVARFVERARGHGRSPRSPRQPGEQRETHGSSPFAQLLSLREQLASTTAEDDAEQGWVERAIGAPHGQLVCSPSGSVSFEEQQLGHLRAGGHLLRPALAFAEWPELSAGERLRLQRRLTAWSRDFVDQCLGPIRDPKLVQLASAPIRGLLYQLEQGLGAAPLAGARQQLQEMGPDVRRVLDDKGITTGSGFVYVAELFTEAAMIRRHALCAVFAASRWPGAPAGVASFRLSGGWRQAAARELLTPLGYVAHGEHALRIDRLEHVARELRKLSQAPSFELPATLMESLGLGEAEAAALVSGLGYRQREDGAWSARAKRKRKRRKRRKPLPQQNSGTR